jgi:quercetin dioxygenase-like cupin family protein
MERVSIDAGETITDKERRNVILLVGRPEITVTWSRYAPGEKGPDLHVHREHTDAFYVLEGELTFAVGPDAGEIRVAAGGYVAVPPGVQHSFLNDGDADARWLNLHAPDMAFAAFMRGQRDGIPVPWDSFDPPPDGGAPFVPGSGDLAVTRDGAQLVVEAGGRVLRIDA